MKEGLYKQVHSLPGGYRAFHIRRLFVKLVLDQIQICKHLLKLNELYNVLTDKCMFKHIVGKKYWYRIMGLIRLKKQPRGANSYLSLESIPCCCSPLTLTIPVEKVAWLWGQLARAESCFTFLPAFSILQMETQL